ncbi:hypothetical protein B9T12_04850 [Wohlfahrtiimonas chitiniclastica]|uniref:adenylate/guanylate cyclase domain-containing protein n=1 Tax=Wohlfahrtiimonas chitiniclastica TaxID=400946 RepID=UPI000B98A386|nr:adenylate/guanylate cyclase domain-containing protein [Wohlfahrtiimonas chitiniclastica]OYQ79107.1 hypothetical protein B9T12_04850 [Wohlfahrtiimonas chitiniclastica]
MIFSPETFNKLVEQQTQTKVRSYAQDAAMSSHRPVYESSNESFPIPTKLYEYTLQKYLRGWFKKNKAINTTSIADHPDFADLIEGEPIHQYITTVFIDIKGSTRLSLLYPDLKTIYVFKNAVIQACIEVIRSFDGYVHRIMGDAVLGFFGSKNTSKPQSILDCMNCVSILTVVLNEMIKPWLKTHRPEFDPNHFGFRIGCDFGDDNDVLWGNYGYGKVGEISPTGLSVDLASKLQNLAQKNQIMIGEGILKYFNFPETFTFIQQTQKNGKSKDEKFVTPNYTCHNGQLLNYMMRGLNIPKYLLGLPLPIDFKDQYIALPDQEKIIKNGSFIIEAKIRQPNDNKTEHYISNSEVVKKGSTIFVCLKATSQLALTKKFLVKFTKTNHSGFDNEPELIEMLDPEQEDFIYDEIKGYDVCNTNASFSRSCSYKGIHEIKCEVLDSQSRTVIFRDYIYVPIE